MSAAMPSISSNKPPIPTVNVLGSVRRKRSFEALGLHNKVPSQALVASLSQKLKGKARSSSPDKKLDSKTKWVSQTKFLSSDLNSKYPTKSPKAFPKKQTSPKAISLSGSAIRRASANKVVGLSSSFFSQEEDVSKHPLTPVIRAYRGTSPSMEKDEIKEKDGLGKRSVERKPLLSISKNNDSDDPPFSELIEEVIRFQEAQTPLSSSMNEPRFEGVIKKIDTYFSELRLGIAQDSVKADEINQEALTLLKQGLIGICTDNQDEALASVRGLVLAQGIEENRRAKIKELDNIGLPKPSKEYSDLLNSAFTGDFLET